jgi:hypothetical protein
MKVIYEFNCHAGDHDDDDSYKIKIFQYADKMFEALNEIADYMRSLRKGWVEDDVDAIEDRISDIISESGIGELE